MIFPTIMFCKLGIHKWEHLGMLGLSLSNSIKRCKRCGAGHLDVCWGQAYRRYSPEEMNTFIASLRERGQ